MKAYSLLVISVFTCCVCKYTLVEIMPKLKKHILNLAMELILNMREYPYVLVKRSVLCNCGIEVENHSLLESLVACHDAESKLVMYFMVNTAFVNYHDNLSDSLKFITVFNRTTREQTLPISLKLFNFDSGLLKDQ